MESKQQLRVFTSHLSNRTRRFLFPTQGLTDGFGFVLRCREQEVQRWGFPESFFHRFCIKKHDQGNLQIQECK